MQLSKRIRAVSGGTASAKTISILLWIIDYAQSVKGKLVSIVSETFPHLSGGAMRDFEDIMKNQNYWKDERYIKTPRATYTFETGTKVEFVSVDTYGKAHGPRRDILFINEANNLSYMIADQLITRTRDIVWLDWNPVAEFWFYNEMLGRREDIDFLEKLTYLDNEMLDESTKSEIESHRHNKNWWKVYGKGELGDIEGRIFTNWQIIDEIPFEARLERRGLDFGYSNDPTAIVDIYKYNQGFILDERLYQKGMHNSQIADFIKSLEEPQMLVIADNAEPKSIDEIKMHGVNIIGSQKGKDSVKKGIDFVQDQKISVTKRSLNLIKEYRNYMWMTDRDGEITNDPAEGFNHCCDAIRYGLELYKDTGQFQNKIRQLAYLALEGEI